MSKEIEVKVLKIDLDSIEEKLIKLNAQLISEEYQRNIIFDAKEPLKKLGENDYLRIREVKNAITNEKDIELTFKENISRDSLRESVETTIKIDNVDSMVYILGVLGYEIIEDGNKHRKSYLYQDIRFDLDTWDKDIYPYPYMEIEVKKPEDLEKAINLLKIGRNKISTKSIMELKKEL